METDAGKNWLGLLKPGDWVFITGSETFERTQVIRFTPKFIVAKIFNSEYKFSKENGSCKLDAWRHLFLKQDTEENKSKLHRKELKHAIRSKIGTLYNTTQVTKLLTENLEIINSDLDKLLQDIKDAKQVALLSEK